jgi:hypothetical protein
MCVFSTLDNTYVLCNVYDVLFVYCSDCAPWSSYDRTWFSGPDKQEIFIFIWRLRPYRLSGVTMKHTELHQKTQCVGKHLKQSSLPFAHTTFSHSILKGLLSYKAEKRLFLFSSRKNIKDLVFFSRVFIFSFATFKDFFLKWQKKGCVWKVCFFTCFESSDTILRLSLSRKI